MNTDIRDKEEGDKPALYKTGVREGFDGWQAWFKIGVQTFYLQPVGVSVDDEENTEEKAKWYQGCLSTALDKLIELASTPVDNADAEYWKELYEYADMFLHISGWKPLREKDKKLWDKYQELKNKKQ